MEIEKRKKVITIRFFDRIAQCGIFERTSTTIKEKNYHYMLDLNEINYYYLKKDIMIYQDLD